MFEREKKFEQFRVTEVRFLCEQDGPPERLLKESLNRVFAQDGRVIRAYLVRADLGETDRFGVVLALRARAAADQGIVNNVQAAFASVFNTKEHLDIVFLTEKQEAQVKSVCKPFYSGAE